MRPPTGFTLLEMLVVLVIVGLSMGMVSLNALPSDASTLQTDAQRIALLLQLARDEAIVRNREIAFEAQGGHYRFLVRDTDGWQPLQNDPLLRDRAFRLPSTQLRLTSPVRRAGDAQAIRIVFGREPVDRPFVLTLFSGDAHADIDADGIGHFTPR